MTDYPSTLRIPEWTPYSLSVDAGVRRTQMDSGNSRQRRKYKTMPTTFSLTFVMTWKQLRTWQAWWNQHAYDWFNMPAVSALGDPASTSRTDCYMHTVRCISNLTISNSNVAAYCRVQCVIETRSSTQTLAQSGWIRAGSANNPSPDWIIAGDTGNPSPDWIIAGTPANPAPVST